MRDRRRCLSPSVVVAAGEASFALACAFPPYRSARAVAAYAACENEIPTGAFIEEAWRSARPLYLPRQRDGSWVSVRDADAAGAPCAGIPEPIGPATRLERGTVVLLPVVAWDATGNRLGRGGGFYDRLLAGLPAGIVRIGLAYEFQECQRIPSDPWDIPMHYVITERRVVVCTRGDWVEVESLGKGGLQPC